MPRYLRLLLLLAGFLPYSLKLPYMFRAWRDSPQDENDWIFVLLFAVLFPLVWMLTRKRKEVSQADYTVLIFMVPALIGYAGAWVIGINALQILFGIAIAYAVFWFIYGGQNAYRVLPCYALLALGVTSTTYWINFYIESPDMMRGLWIKLSCAGVLLLWLLLNFLKEQVVKTKTLLFSGTVCIVVIFIIVDEDVHSETGAPLILNLESGRVGPYISQSQEITPSDIRFFGEGSQIDKYYYIGKQSGTYILALTCGDQIHSIHPASHCLRSSGWTVLSEKILEYALTADTLFVNEIVAEYGGARQIFWVWYTNERFSTASFVNFRKSWDSRENWYTYQLMSPIESGPVDELAVQTRERLFELVHTLSAWP